MKGISNNRGLYIGILLIVLTMAVFAGFTVLGWPGGPDSCVVDKNGYRIDGCYCETLRTGSIRQVANTWSNLGFAIIGLSLLVVAGRDISRGTNLNPMANGSWIAILFGCVVIMMGPGSMFFHASMVAWAGFIDSIAMFLLLTFIVGYDIRQFTRREIFNWLCWVVALAIMATALFLVLLFPEFAAYIFMGFAISTAIFDLTLHLATRLNRSWAWYLSFIGVFSVAMVIWVLSHTGGALCIEDVIMLQGHAWWHVLSAVAMSFLFLYFRSEKGGRPG